MKSKTVNYSNKYKFARKFLANFKIEKGTAIINNDSYNLQDEMNLKNSTRPDREK